EPALPLLLASLYEELDRPLVLLAPEDQAARDAAEGAAWFLGEERVAMLPSRGVHWGSGLDPAPHLVGERARALDVLAAGGLVAASAAALAEPMPPPQARPQPIRIVPGEATSRSRSPPISCEPCRAAPTSSGMPTKSAQSGRKRASSRCRSGRRRCWTRCRRVSRSPSRRSGRPS